VSALKAFSAIVKREFFAYFVSPLAYVVLTAFLLIQGYTFYLIVLALNQPETPRTALMSLFFTSVFYWIFMMLVSAVVAMRLLSEERKTGSIETLLTAPVSEATVVAGKFAAGWCFFLFLWLPTVLYPVLLSRFGTLDWGPIASGYLGIALVGALFISAGTFASALTKNQIVAGMFTERDVLAKFALSGRGAKTTPVRELMSPMVEMATEETTAAEQRDADQERMLALGKGEAKPDRVRREERQRQCRAQRDVLDAEYADAHARHRQ